MRSQKLTRQGKSCLMNRMRASRAMQAAILASAVVGATGVVRADDHPGSTTISTSGSTALRSFIIGSAAVNPDGTVTGSAQINNGMLDLTANTTISFNGITYPNFDTNGNPLTPANALNFWGTGTGGGGQALWLAPSTGTAVTTGKVQQTPALQFQWHEQGSVEGILELASDQLYSGNINSSPQLSSFNPVSRDATSANPIWVNYNRFAFDGSSPTAHVINGYTLNTRSATSGQPNPYTGTGQANVQLAFSDVLPQQGFSTGGSAANNSGAFNRTPGTTGYGKGNPALIVGSTINGGGSATGAGSPAARQQLVDEAVLNAGTRTGGVAGNLTSTALAVTATTFSANPGTGLTQINQQDAQWLQTTSRLSNGAAFNFTTRDAFSGTRNVAALNTGIDPTWAVGAERRRHLDQRGKPHWFIADFLQQNFRRKSSDHCPKFASCRRYALPARCHEWFKREWIRHAHSHPRL